VGGNTSYPNFQDNYGRGYAVEVGTGAGPDWPMFQYDIYRTGNLCALQQASIPVIQKNELNVYPNPAEKGSILYLSANNDLNGAMVTFKEITGRILYSEVVKNHTCKIPNHLPEGLYILSLSAEESSFSTKLIVQ
jgi:hypothetical protein